MPDLTETIAQHPFWKGMNTELLPVLRDCARIQRFEVGQVIFKEGSDADQFHLLTTGQIALETFAPGRGMTTIQTLRGGDALGWSWLYPPYRWHFNARAISETESVSLDGPTLRAEAKSNPAFGYELVYRVGEIMLQRLQIARIQLMDIYDSPA